MFIANILNILKVLIWPILFEIGQIFIICLFILYYIATKNTFDINSISNFINHNTILILLTSSIIFIPIFLKQIKKYNLVIKKCSLKYVLIIIIISFLLSIFLNILINLTRILLGQVIVKDKISFSIILGTCFIGPILEELVYRGIVFNKLKTYYSINKSIIISSIIFALMHTNGLFQMVFAFIFGLLFSYIYNKTNDIKLSITSHIIVNLTSVLVVPILF